MSPARPTGSGARSALCVTTLTALALLFALAFAHAAAASAASAARAAHAALTRSLPSSSNPPRVPAWLSPELPGAAPTRPPQRVVSLAPVLTETVFALGAGGRLVGVTRFCDRPSAAQAVTRVGGMGDVSLERVLALRPDLVLAVPSLGQREVLGRLRDAGIPVRTVPVDRLHEVRAMIQDLGAVLDEMARAGALVARLDAALTALSRLQLPLGPAAVVVGHDPLVVAGPGTFAADVIARTGLWSAVPPEAPLWPTWTVEALATSRVAVLVAAEGPVQAEHLRTLVARAKSRAVVVAPSRPVLMRPGPGLIEDAPVLAAALEAALRPVLAPEPTAGHGATP